MTARKPDRRDPGPDQQMLFRISKNYGKSASKGERQKTVPTVAWARCPMHKGNGQATGLQYASIGPARHLVWKPHTYVTYNGTAATCRASGIALCIARPKVKDDEPGTVPMMRIALTAKQRREDTGERVAKCPHEKSPGVDWSKQS